MMDYKVCRLCLANNRETALLSIFGTEGLDNMFLKLQKCLPFRIHILDGLPKLICYQCLANLDTCYNFLNKAVQSNEILRHHYGKEQGSRAIAAKKSTPLRLNYEDEELEEEDEIKSVCRPCIPRRPMFIERRQNTTRWVLGSKSSSSSEDSPVSTKRETDILDTIDILDEAPPVFIKTKTEATKSRPTSASRIKPEVKQQQQPSLRKGQNPPSAPVRDQSQEKVIQESIAEPQNKQTILEPQGNTNQETQSNTQKHSITVEISQEIKPKIPKIDSKLPAILKSETVNQSIQNHPNNQLVTTNNNIPIESQYQYIQNSNGVYYPSIVPTFTPSNNWPIRPNPIHSFPSAFHSINNQNPMLNYNQYNSMQYAGVLPNHVQNYGFNPLANNINQAMYQQYSQLNSIPSTSNNSNQHILKVEVNESQEEPVPEQKSEVNKLSTKVDEKQISPLQENTKVKIQSRNRRKSNQSSCSELATKSPHTSKTNTPKRAGKVTSPMFDDDFGFDLNFCKECNATLAPHENLFKHMLTLHSKNED